MLGGQFEYLVRLIEILNGKHRLVETVIPNQPLTSVSFILERAVDIRFDGTILIRIQLLLNSKINFFLVVD